ncbi:MarR family winged helix-turn-helix transcriptional regulator [Streptomyces roseifaciens]|uniref:MarR family winged helix-turn-helix transcriptional regulator n=1 Tax=Streptomyces roseifaciens TaxID=1488406 RepID=UPI000717E153|nr:MarR family transcriptional regulator [Streptomyces roseifaciens]
MSPDAPPVPGPLTGEQEHTWRNFVHATRLVEDYLDRCLQRQAGVPHLYYGLLFLLSEAPRRRMRMTELARRAKITRPRLSHAVARLEKLGWARREACPGDRRGQEAVLTDSGREMVARATPGHAAAVRTAVFDSLTPEQAGQLNSICRAIEAGLDREGADLPWLR